ncbi:MAG: hypothetical protein KKH04_15095 [Proteobacteria bacterium]|nr:hypothetical protein [Pseudomonadota bacterium]
MKRVIYILTVLLILISSSVLAQNPTFSLLDDKKGIYAIVRDGRGEAVEGFLRLSSDELHPLRLKLKTKTPSSRIKA